MSKIISLAATQAATNVQVKQSTAKLTFHAKVPDAAAASWTLMLAALNAITINIDLQSARGSTENLIPKLGLGVVAEAYSSNEGIIEVTDNGTNMDVRFSVELGAIGALALDEGQNIVIDTNALAADTFLDIYAFDFPIVSSAAIKTSVIKFNANAPQVVGLQTAAMIHLVRASFEKIEITYGNGRVVTLLSEELRAWCEEGNGVAASLLGVISIGGVVLYSLNTVDAVSAKITTTADVNGYLFTYVQA